MKKLLVLLLGLLLMGCNDSGLELNPDSTYTGSGSVETRTYDLKDFNKIHLNSDFVGTVTKGDTFKVTVTTNADIFDLLEVTNQAGTLVAKVKEDIVLKETSYRIDITMPALSGVTLNNDSSLTSNDAFEADAFNVKTFSDTSLTMMVDSQSLDIAAASDSRVQLSGTTGDIKVHAKSDALVDLGKLSGQSAEVFLYSDSKCIINVSGKVALTSESSPTLKIISGNLEKVSVEEDTTIEE